MKNKPLLLLLSTRILFLAAVGSHSVIFPTILRYNGINNKLVGLCGMFEILACLILAPFIAKIVNRFTIVKILSLLLTIYVVLMMVMPMNFYNFHLALWITNVFMIGWITVSFRVMINSWINMIISNQKRHIILAINFIAGSIGLSAGPVLVKIFGVRNYDIFIINGILAVSTVILITLIKASQPKMGEVQHNTNFKKYFKKTPIAFIMAFFDGFVLASVFGFTVLYGVANGYSNRNAGLFVSAYFFSGVIVYLPLAKFVVLPMINGGVKRIKHTASIFYSIFLISVALLSQSVKFLEVGMLCFFVFGGVVSFAIITLWLFANSSYSKNELLKVNSGIELFTSSGAISGVLITGILMDLSPKMGLVYSLAIISSAYLIYFFATWNKE